MWSRNKSRSPFVTPTTPLLHHSPLHRTLLASSSTSPSPPLPLANARASVSPMRSFAYAPCPQVMVEKEQPKGMEVVALKMSLRPSEQQQPQAQSHGVFGDDGMFWDFGEKGTHFGDRFVDELLNLGDFKDGETEECVKVSPLQVKEAPLSSSSPSSSSAVSFEPAPIPGINLPSHDAADLEWVSYIMDDSRAEFPSSSGIVPPVAENPSKSHLSPTNQLETNAGAPPPAKGATFSPPTAVPTDVPVRAKRSKRGRAATAWPNSRGVFVPFADVSSPSSASSSASSCLIYDHHLAVTGADQSVLADALPSPLPSPPLVPKKPSPKKRGRKPKDRTAPSAAPSAPGERRCSHCGVSKTPQWRAGPLGAKTLCNACGVRFKSGRLLPEYRPACSPQFESSIHSNSHRKVLEMRRKKDAVVAPSPPNSGTTSVAIF